jgi:phospholipase C
MRLASRLLFFLLVIAALAAQAQLSNFKHVVVIVQENRTPDNLFQGLCSAPYGACAVPPTRFAPYNIQTSNWKAMNGTVQPSPVTLPGAYDMGHAHSAFNAMCGVVIGDPPTCLMDGANGIQCIPNTGTTCPPNPPFAYVANSGGILDPYLKLATQYGWANYMFQTNQGPSYPAHQFIFGGTSAPSAADDANGIFAAENQLPENVVVGCNAALTTSVKLISPKPTPPPLGEEDSSVYPCFEHQTMADLVPDWRYYTIDEDSIWTAPNSIDHICLPSDGVCTGFGTHVVNKNPALVLTDIGKCDLSDLTWITPTGQNSDHATSNDGGGPSWVASIVNAIGNSHCTDVVNNQTLTFWQDTAIFITWDDWGGWYDHEPPTILPGVEGDYQYGFRVPLIVVSAYTDQGYVDNSQMDFGSILRFIEHNFASLGITEGELGFADSRATDDLTAFFHMGHPPRKFATVPAPKSADFFIHDTRPAEPPDND